MPAIETRDLAKTFGALFRGGVEAVRGVDLAVERGEIFGILGPNGAGKTTTVKMILGLCRPTRGGGTILGEPIGSPRSRLRAGYLPETPRFPAYHTALGLVAHYGTLSGLSRHEARRRAADVLGRVGLSQWAGTRTRRFTKGMLQRVGLAQAIVHDPEVVFLDEPSDGVDPQGRKDIREILFELRDRGKTVFLNSHLLQDVEITCGRVAIMGRGEVLKQGSVKDLTERGATYEIKTTSFSESLAREVAPLAKDVERRDGGFVATFDDASRLDAIVDLLRARQVGIRAIVPARSSLEDIFIQVVDSAKVALGDGEKAARGPAAASGDAAGAAGEQRP